MKSLLIYCEGTTEEIFVEDVLAPYLCQMGIFASSTGAGGLSRYAQIKRDLTKLCNNSNATVTTMLDFYGLPRDTPGIEVAKGSIYEVAEQIETAIEAEMGYRENLFLNLIVHEFEGLLFSQTSEFEGTGASPGAKAREINQLQKIKNKFLTPEHINNSYDTAPSRRIEKIVAGYQKTSDGIKVAKRIGIDGISSECKHFAAWISKIVSMAEGEVR